VIYSYNKTKEIHYFSDLFDKVLYTFRTVSLSIIKSVALYTQQQVYVIQVCCLLASGIILIYIYIYIYFTVLHNFLLSNYLHSIKHC